MASYHTMLHVGNTGYVLDKLNFFAIRKRDNKGRTVSNTAWTIMISLYAVKDQVFTEWMFNPTLKKNISISFTDGLEKQKEWEFTDVFCVGFEENFIEDLGVLETVLVLTGVSVSNGNATIKYDWGT
ncbi:type VI secretion system tube protein TssD [Spirosoma areae]